MDNSRIEGQTRTLGEGQGYNALHVLDQKTTDSTTGEPVNAMLTAWHPSGAELEKIKQGAPIVVSIFGMQHPPIRVLVGEPTEPVIKNRKHDFDENAVCKHCRMTTTELITMDLLNKCNGTSNNEL